jgi:competence protein ComEA
MRLQTLAVPPWPEAVEPQAPWEEDPARGWPAPDGTPGARLRVGYGFEEQGHDDDVGPVPVRGPGSGLAPRPAASAWDEPRRGLGRWVPTTWLTARWDPGGWGAIGLAVVAALAAVIAAVGVWVGRPVTEPVPALPGVSAGPSSSQRASAGLPAVGASPGGPAPGGPVVVNVAGKVRRPGLVTVHDGARVGEAVDAAGGALPGVDLTPLNLAARAVDGQQILVGVAAPPGAVAPGPAASAPGASAGGGAAGAAPGGKLDLNAATLEQLDGLPGVGPATAKKMLDWRTQNGRFTAVEQLKEIPGIGDARFATLKDLVRV